MNTSLRKKFYIVFFAVVIVLIAAAFIDPQASYELTEIPVKNPLIKR